MSTPANLTQLKKYLTPGMLLRRSHTKHCPVPETVPVVRVQGSAFTIRMTDGTESWHTYTSAKQYAFDAAGFTVNLNEYGTARYEYVADAKPTAASVYSRLPLSEATLLKYMRTQPKRYGAAIRNDLGEPCDYGIYDGETLLGVAIYRGGRRLCVHAVRVAD